MKIETKRWTEQDKLPQIFGLHHRIPPTCSTYTEVLVSPETVEEKSILHFNILNAQPKIQLLKNDIESFKTKYVTYHSKLNKHKDTFLLDEYNKLSWFKKIYHSKPDLYSDDNYTSFAERQFVQEFQYHFSVTYDILLLLLEIPQDFSRFLTPIPKKAWDVLNNIDNEIRLIKESVKKSVKESIKNNIFD
jgi:hypothetical protein